MLLETLLTGMTICMYMSRNVAHCSLKFKVNLASMQSYNFLYCIFQ